MKGQGQTIPPLSLVRLLVALALLLGLPVLSAGVEVGDKAPDFEPPSTNEGKVKLSDFPHLKTIRA